MRVLNSSDQEQDPQPLKWQSEVSSLNSAPLICADVLCRAFNEVLRLDRAKYGVDDEYTIGDTITDEWQQRVDEVVAGNLDT